MTSAGFQNMSFCVMTKYRSFFRKTKYCSFILLQLEEQGQIPTLTNEIMVLQEEIDRTLNEIIERKAKRFSSRYGTGQYKFSCSNRSCVTCTNNRLMGYHQLFLSVYA